LIECEAAVHLIPLRGYLYPVYEAALIAQVLVEFKAPMEGLTVACLEKKKPNRTSLASWGFEVRCVQLAE
jgi:hypothetical protein